MRTLPRDPNVDIDSVEPRDHEKLPIAGALLPAIGSKNERRSGLPEVVFAGLLGWINQWVLDEFQFAIDAFDGESFGVECLVMMGTQGHAVVDAGVAVVGPRLHVVQFTPGRGPVTAGHSTTPVASQNGPTDGFRKLALLAPDGEYFSIAGERDG